MEARPRITFVIPSMRVGGTETQLVQLMDGLRHDFDLALICTTCEGGLIGDVRRMGAHVRVLNARSGWDFTIVPSLRRIIHGSRPHIVHSFLFGFDYFVNRVARRMGVPVILSSRRELPQWQRRRHLFLQRQANRFVDGIVANSQAVAEYAQKKEGVSPSILHVIPNGINADSHLSALPAKESRTRFRLPLDKPVVGMVANFSPVKDHPLFMGMAQHLLKRRKVHFLLVGSGKLVGSMGRFVKRSGQREHFDHISTASEIPEMYGMMDVSVLASKMEGSPNVVIESMAAGKPVVAAAVGGVKELIRHKETGLLVDSRNPKDFAEAVGWCLDNPEEAAAMAQRAAAWVRSEMTVEKMVQSYSDLYHGLLDENPRHGGA
jgi:glycosyltransferase involved in cell wall biosynthesis